MSSESVDTCNPETVAPSGPSRPLTIVPGRAGEYIGVCESRDALAVRITTGNHQTILLLLRKGREAEDRAALETELDERHGEPLLLYVAEGRVATFFMELEKKPVSEGGPQMELMAFIYGGKDRQNEL